MFTGLVQDLGKIAAASGDEVRKLEIATSLPALALGESVAVDGVCLTVVGRGEGTFTVEAASETLARTTAKGWRVGDRVHLERALAFGDRMGGHFVLGHVDAVAKVAVARREPGGHYMEIAVPSALLPLILEKGSITLDGVSLTVNAVRDDRVSVLLIPETLKRTKLGELEPEGPLNIEVDILGKYVARLISRLLRSQLEPERLASELATLEVR
jgi:riboflavin synthase